ncbi:hypothetical protein SLH46_02835 [Draconibacterium sp. IB214405]|uniref:hypothetical protein n=1 Tax=Draconibacterium sp. IB214405 TaxID=3097352 RepID=UPI002A0ED72D|nr:hypothetical protein [Draconibacterium sp. IB214405]MDX8338102.1 hypothetical protein [Draconibacterium sp. IB214405]
MRKAFILQMFELVIWYKMSSLSAHLPIARAASGMLFFVLKNPINNNFLFAEFAGGGRFPICSAKINLVKTGNDYMLQKQNQPVDANS